METKKPRRKRGFFYYMPVIPLSNRYGHEQRAA